MPTYPILPTPPPRAGSRTVKTLLDRYYSSYLTLKADEIGPASNTGQTLEDTFQDNKKDIYGTNSRVLIESRGLINIPRTIALGLESPTSVGGLIGSTVAGLIGGGSTGRPSDTIFKDNKLLSKPISLLAPTQALLEDAVKKDTPYYVKTTPSPALLGTGNPLLNPKAVKDKAVNSFKNGTAQSVAISALNKYGSKSGVKKFKDSLKNRVPEIDQYGPELSVQRNGQVRRESIKYQSHYKNKDGEFEQRKNSLPPIYREKDDYNTQWVTQTDELIKTTEPDKIKEFIDTTQKTTNIPYVLFQVYGETGYTNRSLLLPATVTNLSEQFTPTINSFKYVGSPFNLYRYGGVERIISFDMKMYYTDEETKRNMIKKLNLLREYTFPDRKITTITYGNDSGYSPITFNPNILKLTINGLYKDLHCIIETMTFNIEDSTSWATENNYDGAEKGESKPHPTVINVSLSLKIIEHPGIVKTNGQDLFNYDESEDDGNMYTNYFTGYNEKLRATGEI